jgi:hypothetical protein
VCVCVCVCVCVGILSLHHLLRDPEVLTATVGIPYLNIFGVGKA